MGSKMKCYWELFGNMSRTWELFPLTPPLPTRKKGGPSLHDSTSHWLHGNSIPKIGCHYFGMDYLGTIVATSTLIILFSEMLKFSKKYFFQSKKYCEGK
jgi:hypothetical protein